MSRHKPKHRGSFSTPRPGDRKRAEAASGRLFLYGIHAVDAALGNEKRRIHRLYGTANALARLANAAKASAVTEEVEPRKLDRLVGPDVVHQGVVLETEPIPPLRLDELEPQGLLIVLDQVTDPQNVGAALRSAAAFGASALILHDRHSPPLAGTLAKAASGALELVPIVLVPNLAGALSMLGERDVLRVGLAEEAAEPLETAALSAPLALVLGAEGKGLRQLTRERCDKICRISTKNALASLNVSNAAAIALHWASTALAGAPES